MNYTQLAKTLRKHAEQITQESAGWSARESDTETKELILTLARIVEGKEIHEAFGAPGDWGYGTPIGDALKEAYSG